MVVIRVYTPGNRMDETFTCRAAFQALSSILPFYCIEEATIGAYGYRNVLKKYWDIDDDLCILEQDLIPTEHMFIDMANCQHWNCAYAYRLYPPSLGHEGTEVAHRMQGNNETPDWIAEGAEWSDYAGLGFTKLGRYARRRMALDWNSDKLHHTNMDVLISRGMIEGRIPFHIHWPEVYHFHR